MLVYVIILSVSSCEAQKLWCGHNDCLSFTEVKWRWAMLVLGWVTLPLQCTTRVSDGFALTLVD